MKGKRAAERPSSRPAPVLGFLQNPNADPSAAKTLPASAASCPSEAGPAKWLRSGTLVSVRLSPEFGSCCFFFSPPFRNVASARSHRVSSRPEGHVGSSLRFEVGFVSTHSAGGSAAVKVAHKLISLSAGPPRRAGPEPSLEPVQILALIRSRQTWGGHSEEEGQRKRREAGRKGGLEKRAHASC